MIRSLAIAGACAALICNAPAKAETSLFDLRRACIGEEDYRQFVTGLVNSEGNPSATSFRDFMVEPGGSTRGKAANARRQLAIVEKFFREELNWPSIDGQGVRIYLLGNFSDEDGACAGMNAFFWQPVSDVNLMGIEQGYRDGTEDIADDLDVLGHEFAHGIFASTYRGIAEGSDEVGGVNEGIGDMFGVTVRAWHESGEDLSRTVIREDSFRIGKVFAAISERHYNNRFVDGVMRNNLNPARHGDADHYNYVSAAQREIHSFSGVVTLSYALLVKGGHHPRIDAGPDVHGIGFEKAVTILFYTLKNGIPFNSMPEFASAMQRSAGRLYGEGSLEWRSTTNAFAATGLATAVAPYPSEQPSEPEIEPEPELQRQPEPEPAPPPVVDPAPQQPPAPTQPVPTPAQPSAGPQVSGPVVILILGGFVLAMIIFGSVLKKRRREQLEQLNAEVQQVHEVKASAAAPAAPIAVMPADMLPPTIPSESRGAVLSTADVTLQVDLNEIPLVIGRDPALDLPKNLARVLADDGTLSRSHVELWYNHASDQLYIRCLSANGLKVNDRALAKGEKAKVDFDKGAKLTLGSTILEIQPH